MQVQCLHAHVQATRSDMLLHGAGMKRHVAKMAGAIFVESESASSDCQRIYPTQDYETAQPKSSPGTGSLPLCFTLV